jgi:hypothetical protein
MKAADWISTFSGSLPFLFLHCALFALWIGLNTGPLARTALHEKVDHMNAEILERLAAIERATRVSRS